MRERHAVGLFGKRLCRLVKADVTVVTQAQKLDVHAAMLFDSGLVGGASCSGIGVGAIGYMRGVGIYVHMVKEMLGHEVVVALHVVVIKAAVLVQVEGGDVFEGDLAGLVVFDELGIEALWSGARCQAKRAIRLLRHDLGDDVCRLAAHFLVVFSDDKLHGSISLGDRFLSQYAFERRKHTL